MKIEKERVEAIIHTEDFRIEGVIHVLTGERITDFITASRETFIAVTNASVFRIDDDKCFFKTAFLSLNKNRIVFISPKEELVPRTREITG